MLLIFGKNGQLGRALELNADDEIILLGPEEADFAHPEKLSAILDKYSPEAVINASAYTQVDKAEEERDLAMKINAEAPGEIAQWCAKKDIPFVHFSTDYVFDGSGNSPWIEDDQPDPLNAYGESKHEGENRIKAAGGKYLILRTSWVYDETGENFLNTMLKLAKEKSELSVVSDQIGAPTYAIHLANAAYSALDYAIQKPTFPSGVYHACNAGETSWQGFAEAIFKEAELYKEKLKVQTVKPIATSEYPTAAKRPLNSRLNCEKSKEQLGIEMPDWKVGLRMCMKEKYAA